MKLLVDRPYVYTEDEFDRLLRAVRRSSRRIEAIAFAHMTDYDPAAPGDGIQSVIGMEDTARRLIPSVFYCARLLYRLHWMCSGFSIAASSLRYDTIVADSLEYDPFLVCDDDTAYGGENCTAELFYHVPIEVAKAAYAQYDAAAALDDQVATIMDVTWNALLRLSCVNGMNVRLGEGGPWMVVFHNIKQVHYEPLTDEVIDELLVTLQKMMK